MKHSLLWCEGRLSRAEVLTAHQTRLRLRAFKRLSSRYLDELDNLMSDPNPVIRARALEAFRRTVGLEMSGGLNVNVNLRTTVSNAQPCSFEEVMERVRAKLVAEQREQALIAAPGDASITAKVSSK